MADIPARYFLPTDRSGDADFLPATIGATGKWKDLGRVAEQVEADVFRVFTRDLYRSGAGYTLLTSSGAARALGEFEEYTLLADGRRAVFLRGYKESAADATDAAFKTAVKRTCALIVEWRYLQGQENRQMDAESDGTGKHHTKAANHQQEFPPNWKRWLKDWITLDPLGATRL